MNPLASDFLDEHDGVVVTDEGEGNYDEFLNSIDTSTDDSTSQTSESQSTTETGEQNTETTDSQTATSTADWEEVPTPIADWQNVAKNNNIPAGSEAELRENLTLKQYVQDAFNQDTESHHLYHLASEDTPARTRISRYVAEKVKEPYEQVNDPDVLSRVEGALTDYFDDENNLTPKGDKLNKFLIADYGKQLSQKTQVWASQAKTAMDNQKLFVSALQASIAAESELTAEQQREAYRYIRRGNLERIVNGVDETGKALPPAEIAKRQAEASLWANPDTRKLLLQKREDAAYKKGQSDTLKKQLN